MKAFKKSASVLLSFVMLFSLATFNASAVKSTNSQSSSKTQTKASEDSDKNKEKFNEIISSFNNPNGRLMSVAHKGNWRNFPENSLEGIKSCIDMGVDIVEVDIQRTKDGKFVLMSDNDLTRMCVNKDGQKATSKVSDESLEELKEYYYLRDSRGGVNAKATKYQIPSLEDAISLCKDNIMIMIDNAWKYGDEVQSIVKSLDADALVILRGAKTPEEISTYIKKNELPISHICGYYEGVMSSPAKRYVKDTISAGAKIIELSSENSYSSLYRKSVLKKFDNNGRAFISTVSPEKCGDREDMQADWDDLIDRGFSVIETNYPQELVNYIKSIEEDKAKLSSLITQAQGLNITNYSKATAKELKKALDEAEKLSSDGSSSLNKIDFVRYNIQKSIDNMEPRGENEKDGIGTGTIIALIIIGLVVIVAVVFVLMKSKKNKPSTSPFGPNGPGSNPNGLNPNGQQPPQGGQPRPKKRKKLTFNKKAPRKKRPPVRENPNNQQVPNNNQNPNPPTTPKD